jgi:ferredoxin-NADP reductase/fatty acid desaturase
MSATLPTPDWQDHAGGVAVPTIALMAGIVIVEGLTWASVIRGALPLALGTVVTTLCAYAAFTVMHEACHGNLDGGDPRFSALEELLGWLAGAVLFAPYSAFRVMHLLHHAHTNDPERDPDHWVVGGNALSVAARCLTIVPYYYAGFLFGRSSQTAAARSGRLPTVLGVAVFLAAFGALCAAGLASQAVWLWLVPAVLASGMLAFAFDWLPHHPHALQERYRDTRVLLIPGATVALLGQNYHLIHHLHPRVPFYKYGRVFRELRPELERRGAPIEGFGALTRPFATALRTPAPRETHRVRIVEVSHPTAESVALRFEPLGWTLEHRAGQHLVFEVALDGQPLRRCYSLFTAPGDPRPGVCVKRLPGGQMSTWLLENARPGLELTVRPPTGRFAFDGGDEPVLLVAAGSGITPLRAIAEQALATTAAPVTLLYGNRAEHTVIFADDLAALQARYPARFTVEHVLSAPTDAWSGARGRLDAKGLPHALERVGGLTPGCRAYLCGPATMLADAHTALRRLGLHSDRIHQERFTAPQESERPPTEESATVHRARFTLRGAVHEVLASPEETLLAAALRASIPVPHACTAGQCGSCVLTLRSGTVDQRGADALLDRERKAGAVLTCCSRPRSDVELVDGAP